MKHQQRDYWCGVASVQNALECIGIKVTQGELAKKMAVTEDDGASEEELKRAVLAANRGFDECHEPNQAIAENWLWEFLVARGPVVLCVDEWDHWVTVIGVMADRYVVFDPAKGAGIRVYDRQALLTRWRLGRRHGGPLFYALGVA
jgi:ABC-type bacteriocin/lantibiotic exporter with double-glycine peptidase domain